jgi:hypothetical protein
MLPASQSGLRLTKIDSTRFGNTLELYVLRYGTTSSSSPLSRHLQIL